eukprot:CAMPEP_0177471270 /NCGR_PEP_ID=MMETSP0369-20130122/20672_1 /TAXON_ID=447022 ORGANISM="Scrippsiella hangoei-like, Strain SHHI-4" /NCGR_SAMPLE_ID=MMETSP0369 /ASSEMBLY_ACC=CAM_ASM_000364 /LENGTH=77 /DNA_ID=CAMNT_0018945839 /DNA_START=115 /DNA_END=345 /DNA_ORIENTATION=+
MRLDRDVGGRIGHACEAEAIVRLVLIQESLIGLVDRALEDPAGTRGARARAARIGQLNTLLLGLIKDVHVLRALEGL